MDDPSAALPLPVPGQRDSEDDRQRKLAALRVRLHEEAQAMRTPEDWARCLRLAARLPGESFANILLISAQRPGATLLRGYDAWHAIGRQVSGGRRESQSSPPPVSQGRGGPGTKPVPTGEMPNGSAICGTFPRPVALRSTRRAAIPLLPGRAPPGLWDALCWLARREGFAVEREYGCPDDGVTMWAARRIRVLPDPDEYQAVWALAHQLGHVLLHNPSAACPAPPPPAAPGSPETEANSVAYIICTRYGITTTHQFPSPPDWAGRDPRAQPAAAILTVGERVTAAPPGSPVTSTPRCPGQQASFRRSTRRRAHASQATAGSPRPGRRPGVLHQPAPRQLGTALPAHARHRRRGDTRVGHRLRARTVDRAHRPPAEPRTRGRRDPGRRASPGPPHAERSSTTSGTGSCSPVLDEHGTPAGFIGRARPGSRPEVPKYLNSPETTTYRKGDLLFGLHQARAALARGAVPVIVEGPFDAIAITIADPSRHVGLAPCGTALTSQQVAALAAAADLPRVGVLAAFDSDQAGRKAATRAYGILRPFTGKLGSVLLAAKDPAEILQRDGPAALRTILRDQIQPLSAVIIDARIEPWERRLRDTDGPLLAMRDAARLIVHLLPPDTTTQIRQVTGDRELTMTDDLLHPIDNPELTEIASLLPADTPYQIMRVADRLGFDVSEVLAEVANAVTEDARSPKGLRRIQRVDVEDRHPACSPAQLTDSSFPRPFLVPQHCVRHTHPPGVTSPVRCNTAPSRRQAPPST